MRRTRYFILFYEWLFPFKWPQRWKLEFRSYYFAMREKGHWFMNTKYTERTPAMKWSQGRTTRVESGRCRTPWLLGSTRRKATTTLARWAAGWKRAAKKEWVVHAARKMASRGNRAEGICDWSSCTKGQKSYMALLSAHDTTRPDVRRNNPNPTPAQPLPFDKMNEGHGLFTTSISRYLPRATEAQKHGLSAFHFTLSLLTPARPALPWPILNGKQQKASICAGTYTSLKECLRARPRFCDSPPQGKSFRNTVTRSKGWLIDAKIH